MQEVVYRSLLSRGGGAVSPWRAAPGAGGAGSPSPPQPLGAAALTRHANEAQSALRRAAAAQSPLSEWTEIVFPSTAGLVLWHGATNTSLFSESSGPSARAQRAGSSSGGFGLSPPAFSQQQRAQHAQAQHAQQQQQQQQQQQPQNQL